MNSWLPIILSGILLVSCGKNEETKSQSIKTQVTYLKLGADPIRLKKQIKQCKSEQEAKNINNLFVPLFLEGVSVGVDLSFVGLINNNFIKNLDGAVISQTTYGQEIENFFSLTTSGPKLVIHSEARELDICPDETFYLRDTFESAGLLISHFVNKTRSLFKRIAPELNLTPITVSVTPLIKHSLEYNNQINFLYEVDNASYSAEKKSITFLPTSEGSPVNLWEVPMVASHEYGHHVFDTAMPKVKLELSGTSGCFDLNNVPSVHQLDSEDIRVINQLTVLMALNEGFADLVSYYSLDDNQRGLTGVNCLEVNREVGSEIFFNGMPKVFSTQVQNEFFSTFKNQVPDEKTCNDINFQEIHIIGALFAHNADKFMSLYTGSKDEKMLILLNWVKTLNTDYQIASTDPKRYFIHSYKTFIRTTLKKLHRPFNKQVCDHAERFFPEIKAQIRECGGWDDDSVPFPL